MAISRTAVKVATGVIALAHDPAMPKGAGDASARILRAAGLLPGWRERLARSRVARTAIRFSERLISGGSDHLVRRKAFFDAEARAGPRAALVVLGAGLDTLAARFAAEFPETECYEVDLPGTSAAKEAAVVRGGLDRANLHFVAHDVGCDRLSCVLEGAGLPRGTPATITAEGLLMYLDRDAVAGMLVDVSQFVGQGSRFAFSWMRRDARGASLVRFGVSLVSEPIRWTTDAEDARDLLLASGWSLEGTTSSGLECLASATRHADVTPAGPGSQAQ